MKPIRMPMTSADCDLEGASASCESRLIARPGQKIAIKAGVYFSIGPNPYDCTEGYVKFYSANSEQEKEDKSCGQVGTGVTVFNSVSDQVTVTYNSDSIFDGATLNVVGMLYPPCILCY